MRTVIAFLLLYDAAVAQTLDRIVVEVAPGVTVELTDLAARDAEMRTPLHQVAATTGDAELVRLMLERGADARARDVSGRTPLHAAAEAGAPLGVLAALLGGGADLRARDSAGLTAQHLAATAEGAALLAMAGGEGCARDAGGAPALSAAMLERIRVEAPAVYPQARVIFLDCLR